MIILLGIISIVLTVLLLILLIKMKRAEAARWPGQMIVFREEETMASFREEETMQEEVSESDVVYDDVNVQVQGEDARTGLPLREFEESVRPAGVEENTSGNPDDEYADYADNIITA